MEYRPVRIVDVIRDINRIYFLPDIQREFVWENEKVERLFDSIMGDFPIGSFLFRKVLSENKNDWNTYEFIKNFDKEAPHNEPVITLIPVDLCTLHRLDLCPLLMTSVGGV